jgi:hypothetical protein
MNFTFEDKYGALGPADEHRPDCAVLHEGFFCGDAGSAGSSSRRHRSTLFSS